MIVFVLILAATTAALTVWMPEREDIPVISQKLAAVREHGSKIDTLFIGTSRVYHQIDPALFDEQMAKQGHASRSYNLGADGMLYPETFHVLESALTSLPHLKLVVIEVGAIQHGWIPPFPEESLRSLYWRDLDKTWMITRSIMHSPASASKPMGVKCARIWRNFELMAANANGSGACLLEACLKPEPAFGRINPDDNGYLPIYRRMSAADIAAFREKLKTKIPTEKLPRLVDPELRDRLGRLVAELNAKGVKTCFLLFPSFRPQLPEIPPVSAYNAFIDFDDSALYPDFFKEEHYYDTAHLNEVGARLFTTKLAEEILRLFREQ